MEFAYDTDGKQAVASRLRVFDMLASQRVAAVTYHFPWPGLGHIGKQGDGYRLFPDAAADCAGGGCKGRQNPAQWRRIYLKARHDSQLHPRRRQGLCPRPSRGHLGGGADSVPAGWQRSMRTAFAGNLRHWVDDLGIDGVFVSGKQGEFFSMSLAERKRTFDIAVEEIGGARTILSCSDQNLDTVIELARYAQAIGSDYIVVHAPVLHFLTRQDDTLLAYYRTVSEAVDIGIALWSHPDSGYLMSPELCARVAELPNIVAIKYSVPREMYASLTQARRRQADRQHRVRGGMARQHHRARLAALSLLVTALSLSDQARIAACATTPTSRFSGEHARAKAVRDSLNPVREAFKRSRPPEKFHASFEILAGAARTSWRRVSAVRCSSLPTPKRRRRGAPSRAAGSSSAAARSAA